MELTTANVTLPARLDPEGVATLTSAVEAALTGPARIVVLSGASADVFCLGLAIDAAADGVTATHAFAALFARLHASPKPLVAAIDGAAIGGGLGLACACDWVVATHRSTFGLPELLWGLVPAIIWPVVTDRMAPHVARQWTLSAHTRRAADAHAAGVVDEVVADGTLDAGLRRSLRSLNRIEPLALARLRGWSRESRALSLPEAAARGAAITASLMTEPQVQARWRAYANGEAPWCA